MEAREQERLDLRVLAGLVGSAAGQYLGLGLLLPGLVAAVAFALLNRRQALYPYALPISVYLGHSGWMLVGTITTGKLDVLSDVVLMLGGSCWLAVRPSRRVAQVLLAYSLLCLGLNIARLLGGDKSATKALVTHALLNATALSSLWWALTKHKPEPPQVAPASGSRVMARVAAALGVLWAVGCLLASLSGYSTNRVNDVAWGLVIGAFPWGVWWFLRGFQNWHRIVGGFSAFVGLLAMVLYGVNTYRQEAEEAERLESYTRIPKGQVEVVDARLSDRVTYNPPMSARVRNRNTSFTVTGLELNFRVYDCPDEKTPVDRCDLVASPSESVTVLVPPLQSRDIQHSISVPSQYRIRGHMQWDMELDKVRARP